jgi:hypothetical protein
MNASAYEHAKTLQLWVFLTLKLCPDQKSFDIENQINTFVNVVSPKDQNDGNALWVLKNFFSLRNI